MMDYFTQYCGVYHAVGLNYGNPPIAIIQLNITIIMIMPYNHKVHQNITIF